MAKEKHLNQEDTITTDNSLNKHLILHNDDYHTFDYVIDALIDVCNHEIEQAVQCTYIVHNKGKADVKKGSYEFLKPMMKKLRAKDLKATID
ncbi:MAG: ATP-dependent Clp protease adaptor ClpS [Chlorobi bacterium]|nr:ATP-dependent Clp protease adaptor ClpS [Chlorobiota bacterium]